MPTHKHVATQPLLEQNQQSESHSDRVRGIQNQSGKRAVNPDAKAAQKHSFALKQLINLIKRDNMAVLSFELVLFIAIMFAYTRIRKSKIYPLELIRGLTIYLPPTQADFDVLESTNTQARESAKGKVNKYDAKHTSKLAKFPMRTFQIKEELLQYCKDFFPEFEFMFMLFGVIMILFAVVLAVKLVAPSLLETNLVFYLTTMVLLVCF
jgi:hypothetical protein